MTRREVLIGLASAGSLAATSVNFDVPAHACDCHTHVFGDAKQFPLWSGRTYTPEVAGPAEMAAVHRNLHIERVVIVTPSIYGTDNSATLMGLRARGGSGRGIAVIDAKTTDAELDTMHRAGVRGIRLNLSTGGHSDLGYARRAFADAVDRVTKRKWHLQIYAELAIIAGIRDLVLVSPTPVVFDHFGHIDATQGVQQPGFSELLSMVNSGKAWVKISGAYRASKKGPDYPDVAPFAQALIQANAKRIVWGTDWPHPDTASVPGRKATDIAPLLKIDDARIFNRLPVWAPNVQVRKTILVDNPMRLYDF
jgi:predicted TIM-barrel fold metal-dependent hydrolase